MTNLIGGTVPGPGGVRSIAVLVVALSLIGVPSVACEPVPAKPPASRATLRASLAPWLSRGADAWRDRPAADPGGEAPTLPQPTARSSEKDRQWKRVSARSRVTRTAIGGLIGLGVGALHGTSCGLSESSSQLCKPAVDVGIVAAGAVLGFLTSFQRVPPRVSDKIPEAEPESPPQPTGEEPQEDPRNR